MFCSTCGTKNRSEAKFCKDCGARLNISFKKVELKLPNWKPLLSNASNILNSGLVKLKWNLRISLIGGLVILLLVLSPFAHAHYRYTQARKQAEKFFSDGEYGQALERLGSINQARLLPSIKSRTNFQIELYSKVKDDDAVFASAKSEEAKGNLVKAKELLSQLSNATEYPKFADVLKELNTVSDRISGKQVAEAQQASESAAAKAEAERANRQRAEQAASKSAAEAAANQAAADAAQRQSAANAAAAEQEAQSKAQALRTAFRNEVVDAYNAFNQALSHYGSGIQYSNNGSSILALSKMSNAKALLNGAYTSINTIKTRYAGSGIPVTYLNAATNMISAINSLNYACDLVIQSEGTSLDLSSTINTNRNSAVNYFSEVKNFLDNS